MTTKQEMKTAKEQAILDALTGQKLTFDELRKAIKSVDFLIAELRGLLAEMYSKSVLDWEISTGRYSVHTAQSEQVGRGSFSKIYAEMKRGA